MIIVFISTIFYFYTDFLDLLTISEFQFPGKQVLVYPFSIASALRICYILLSRGRSAL